MMYLVAEFLHMITAALLIVICFFGGWHFWGLTGAADVVTWPQAILRVMVLGAKIMAMIFFFMLARWSWPRFRFDQLMALAWKVMLPLGLVNVVVVAICTEYGVRLARSIGVSPTASMAACGWGVLLVSWLVVTLAVPEASDNRPRRQTEETTLR